MDTIVICSGGLDSVSLAYKVAAEHRLRGLLSFDYGQRHVKEVEYAAACAKRLGVPHKVVDISNVGAALSGSALTDDVDVPDGHYAEETMKITIVPNRNAIMLAIAFGMAAAEKADAVAAAVPGANVEVFVHGHMCVSYNGQCFSSESSGGRSANRGQCAQQCPSPSLRGRMRQGVALHFTPLGVSRRPS